MKKNPTYFLLISLMTIFSIQSYAQPGCNNENILDFSDAGIHWASGAQSGTFTAGLQTFDISISDADHIFQSATESNQGLEIYIDPDDRHDVLTITYDLSETANQVSFPIADLDKKSSGSNQQEQVCVYGYLGVSPIPIMPNITSLDGAVSIDGNCATATTNSAISGQDESIFVEFDECIDRIVIEYGSGPMAPSHPDKSKIYIGEGTGFSTNVCSCGPTCTDENTLDFTDAGINWADEALEGIYTVGSQTYTVNIFDDDLILETNMEDGPYSSESDEGIRVGINPSNPFEFVTLRYFLSEVSNNIYFKIRDLDKKASSSNQQEKVRVYGMLGNDATRILPTITSFDGSVLIEETPGGTCATATTNSALSGQEESVFVQFDECIDKIFIVYGSGPMAPSDPTYSAIYIGEEFGFYTAVCDNGCTVACEADAGTLSGGSETCLLGASGVTTDLSATPDNNAVVPAGYLLRYVLTSGDNFVIEEISMTPDFTVDAAGLYTIHTLVYSTATLDLGNVVFGTTTAAEVNAIIQSDDAICAALDLTGTAFNVVSPNAGTLTANGDTEICLQGGSVNISAAPDNNTVIPTGYEVLYVLTSGNELLIEEVRNTPGFTIDGSSDRYTIHTLVYNSNTLDLNTIQIGVTTGAEVNALLVGGGADGTICADLDVTGAVFLVTEINTGGLTPDAADYCLPTTGSVQISATPDGNIIVPTGYEVLYVLTSVGNIIDSDSAPSFPINAIGDYTIHTLVYNTADGLDLSVATAGEAFSQISAGGGDICAALDLSGINFIIENCPIPFDNDLDNDGISNIQEGNGVDPSADDDNDGIANYQDTDYPNFIDTNNDGINDNFDTDLDGIANIFDLDSDNDGIADIVEAGGIDADQNGDGMVDVFIDIDGDGWTDTYDNDDDTTPELNDGTGIPLANADDDKDGLPNAIDLDSDSDGIADIVEAGGIDSNGDGYIDNTADIDGDGYADIVDTDDNTIAGPDDGGTALPSPDSDGDGLINALDLDSDNDGVTDLSEAGGTDSDSDGRLDQILDADGDGLANSVDTDNNNIAGQGDGGTALESPDSDNDGLIDAIDLDSDNDGIADIVEAGGIDTNQDGVADDITDTDNDGFAEIFDTNNNNIPGNNDGNGTALTNPDTDNDGINNLIDLDSDGDEIPDIMEVGIRDENGDGMIDDTADADNDGYVDIVDADNNAIIGNNDGGLNGDGIVAIQFIIDTDGDAAVDYLDLDSDNDGMADILEAGGRDADNNGITDAADSDKDGLADTVDPDDNNIPGPNDGLGAPLYILNGSYIGILNKDEDGQPDFLDLDSDNDGISDLCESIGDMQRVVIKDSNNDGIVDGIDSDNDGIIDNIFINGGTLLTPINTDNDLVPNHLDIDADGDGIIDLAEAQPTFDYLTPDNADIDGDGINDKFDSDPNTFGGFFIIVVDTDGDGVPDYLDLNADNDDEDDSTEGFDIDGDGVADTSSLGIDTDNDGLDSGYDNQNAFFDATNNGDYGDMRPDTDAGSEEKDWRSACLSVQLAVFLEGAMTKPQDQGYLTQMRADLDKRGVLPGQTPQAITLDTTAAGQPYHIAPWNYDGREGEGWDDDNYDEIIVQYGQIAVDWVLVSFRKTPAVDSEIAKTAAIVLEDGTVIFLDNCFLNTFDTELYIVVEHRNHIGVMSPEPVPIVDGRMVYDFRNTNSYVGPNPANPIGAGQLQVLPGIFAMYGGDGEQVADANVLVGPSYNITGDDKIVWEVSNGRFAVYLLSDYDMNGDTNGADKIIWDVHNGTFSVVPR